MKKLLYNLCLAYICMGPNMIFGAALLKHVSTQKPTLFVLACRRNFTNNAYALNLDKPYFASITHKKDEDGIPRNLMLSVDYDQDSQKPRLYKVSLYDRAAATMLKQKQVI